MVHQEALDIPLFPPASLRLLRCHLPKVTKANGSCPLGRDWVPSGLFTVLFLLEAAPAWPLCWAWKGTQAEGTRSKPGALQALLTG